MCKGERARVPHEVHPVLVLEQRLWAGANCSTLVLKNADTAGRGQRRGDGPVDQGRHAHDKAQDLVHQVQIGVDKVLLQVDVFIVPLLFIGKFVARMALIHDFLDSIEPFFARTSKPHVVSAEVLQGGSAWCRAFGAVSRHYTMGLPFGAPSI